MGHGNRMSTELPESLSVRLRHTYGDFFPMIERGFRAERPVTLRVNTCKTTAEAVRQELAVHGIKTVSAEWYEEALIADGVREQALEETPLYARGEIYLQSLSSMLPPILLRPQPGENILDMTAAPGGKTVVLASMMPDGALLTANERSAARRARLSKTIAACLPPDVQRRVRVTGADAAALCRYANTHEQYDRILLDAPCSSERHVLRDARYLNEWSYSRIRSLAAAQWSLISSAYRLLARGGKLVYATCALSPEENDCIIERFTAKYPDMTVTGLPQIPRAEAARFCADPLSAYEQTRCGFHVLPDVQSGAGPLFFSCLNKAP